MSGPQTIEPSGRTTTCSDGCIHPICASIRVAARRRAVVDREIEIDTLAAQIRAGIFADDTGRNRTIDRALAALDRLTTLAKEPR